MPGPTLAPTMLLVLLLAVPTTAAASGPAGTVTEASPHAQAPLPPPPPLPFDDNPDPDQCGIPTPLGDGVTGSVSGRYDGRLVFERVHLYDSHLRAKVTGLVPDGARVEVVMMQINPTLDFFLVRWEGPDGRVQGWIPAPFLDLDG